MTARRPDDPRYSPAANAKRRLKMLRFHASQRDPETGKSLSAAAGGRAAWQKRAEATLGGERALALELALKRWHPEDGAPPEGGDDDAT